MEKRENFIIIGGIASILIGVLLTSTENEGKNINRVYLGATLLTGGFSLLGYGLFKK